MPNDDNSYLTGDDARRVLGLVDDALANYDVYDGTDVISQPEAEPASASAPVGAAQRLLDAHLAGRGGGVDSTSVTGNGRLLNTAPGWYTPEEPPKSRTTLGALGAGAGALAQGAQATAEARAQDPYRSPQNKAKDQVNATKAGLASSLLGYFAGQPQAEFQQRQDAALKDAQMQKLARDSATMRGESELGWANLAERLDQHKAAAAAAEAKAKLAAEMDNPTSERSARMRAAARAAGLTQVTDDMSANDVNKMRTALMQAHHEDFQAGQYDIKHGNEQADRLAGEERAQHARIQQEQRELQAKNEERAIPGYEYASGRAPSPEMHTKAAETLSASQRIERGAEELAKIQKELNDANLMVGALGGSTVGGFDLGMAMAPAKQAALLARAKQLRGQMITDSRANDHLGVMQQFEKTMEEGFNPAAGSLTGFFTGPVQWDAVKERARNLRETNMTAFGYVPAGQGGKSHLDAPAESMVTRYAKPAQRSAKTGEALPQPGEVGSRPGPPAPAPPPGPGLTQSPGIKGTAKGAIGIFQIANGTAPYYLTQQQYDLMVQKYGADKVKRLQ